MRVLLFSTLFPSAARPGHGVFVETRMRELRQRHPDLDVQVLAPVPWFFSSHPRFGDYATMAATPAAETRHGVRVLHPRYVVVPKIGMHVAPLLLALGAMPALRRLMAGGFRPDLIDAHYFFPDGVAAAMLGRWFGIPVTITARGSDLNLIGQFPMARRMMIWAAGRAAACLGVCQALVDVLQRWGVARGRLHVAPNGVDLQRFTPRDQAQARESLGLAPGAGPVLLCVGHLVPLKGHALVLEALSRLSTRHPQAQLLIVGDGPERESLIAQAASLGLSSRVRMAGAIPNDQLARWYSAADLLVLASSREGWANVLLESMACGTPVVATPVGGTPEVVATPEAGVLVEERSAAGIERAVQILLDRRIDRAAVRRYAEGFDWARTSALQHAIFSRAAGQRESVDAA